MSLGIDLGTSGVRIAVINKSKELVYTAEMAYQTGLENVADWEICCERLIQDVPLSLKSKLIACAVDGTSGTILACNKNGKPLGNAVPYYINCPEQSSVLKQLMPLSESVSNINSSLARAMRLTKRYGNKVLLRHQADWVNGWLMDNWKWGEEGNNLRLGWDLLKKCWPAKILELPLSGALPQIVSSGTVISKLSPNKAKRLHLSEDLLVVAGTTDSNAAVMATDAGPDDGITILGSTTVLKRFVKTPLHAEGISNHLVGGKWITGGSSNSGAAVLRQIFTDKELRELSISINPETSSGLMFRPLPFQGERFPIQDPFLEPILEPRPISDSLYLHGLLEGLTRIEAQGWEKLKDLGVPFPKQLITLGGGAANPQWRRLRERALGLPIKTCQKLPAQGIAQLALDAIE